MKPHRPILSLLFFNLKSVPAYLWIVPAIYFFPFVIQAGTLGDLSGFSGTFGDWIYLVAFASLGLLFFSGNPSDVSTFALTPIPNGEFLVVRPIRRSDAYCSRLILFFLFMLTPSVLNLALSVRQPDVRFSLYQSRTQRTEASEKLRIYQAQFPGSSISQKAESSTKILTIPRGRILIAGCGLWLAVVVTLGLQLILVSGAPTRLQRNIVNGLVLLGVVLFLFASFGKEGFGLVERAFFGFARHWGAVAVVTLLLAAGIQWFAYWRICQLDVD